MQIPKNTKCLQMFDFNSNIKPLYIQTLQPYIKFITTNLRK